MPNESRLREAFWEVLADVDKEELGLGQLAVSGRRKPRWPLAIRLLVSRFGNLETIGLSRARTICKVELAKYQQAVIRKLIMLRGGSSPTIGSISEITRPADIPANIGE